MKKVFFLITILFGLLLSVNVHAESVSIKLTCSPELLLYGGTGKCYINGEVLENDLTITKFLPSKEGKIDITGYDKSSGVLTTGNNVSMGTITFKATSMSGDGKVHVAVTFSDETTLEATSNTINIVSNVNTLSKISIDDKNINITDANATKFTSETKASTIKLDAVATDNNATISGTGSKNLACGENSFDINVKATNASVKKYTVVVTRKCEDNILKDIKLSSGVLSPKLDKKTFNYTVNVSKNVEKITIKAVKNFDSQKISGEVTDKELQMGSNTFVLTATNDEGKEQKYNIVVNRSETLESNAYLSDLSLSSGKISFDKDTFEYRTKVLYNVDKINVLATPLEKDSKVTVTGADKLQVGDNKVEVKVTTSNNESNTYVINVIRLKLGEKLGDNANIKNIKIAGYDLKFDYNKENYKLVVKDTDELDITVEMDDEFATYEIAGNKNLKDGGLITIVTKSADDQNTKTYTIKVTKPSLNILFYVLGGILLLCLIFIPLIIYLIKRNKNKKNVDINGLNIDEKEAEVLTTNQILNDVPPINTPIINDQSQVLNDDTIIHNISANNCPSCGRELVGELDVCPYCGKILI